MKQGVTLSTLGDLKTHCHTLFGHCTGQYCGRGRPLDLDALIERVGANYVVIRETLIAAALVCKSCGHKGGKLAIHPPAYQSAKSSL